jgi:hypothetical protein
LTALYDEMFKVVAIRSELLQTIMLHPTTLLQSFCCSIGICFSSIFGPDNDDDSLISEWSGSTELFHKPYDRDGPTVAHAQPTTIGYVLAYAGHTYNYNRRAIDLRGYGYAYTA